VNSTNSAPALDGDLLHPDMWVHHVLNPTTQSGAIELAFVFLVLAWLCGRALHLAVHRVLDKAQRAGSDPTGIRFLGQLARVMVYIFAFVIYSHLVTPLQHLGGSLLTSMGLLSVVVGLAAQSTLGNLISGISLVLYRPFKVGDELQVAAPKGPEIGVVESINLGMTVLRTADNRRIVMPNNTIASQTCVNLTETRKGAPCTVAITVPAGADVEKARAILLDIAKANPRKPAVESCHVTALTGAGAELTLSVCCADAGVAADVKSELLEAAKKQFDAAGIKIA
jgi:small-conductance mechanosensitive channel